MEQENCGRPQRHLSQYVKKGGQLENKYIEDLCKALNGVIDSLRQLNLAADSEEPTPYSRNSCIEDDSIQKSLAQLVETCGNGSITAEK